MNQGDFTGVFTSRPQNFAWFLGAGASRAAGLPTATDILWDMKRRYYCREENQEITRQDVQNSSVRDRIASFMSTRGFPSEGALDEYSQYFERIFGDDKERQRRYLRGILDEGRTTLSVGNRVLGAFLASGLSRAAFTTNFDTIVERAVAETAGKSLLPYHLEGSAAAIQALNNEEFPLYSKLHGDFRYDSLKNLPEDLATQNAALSACLVTAGNRFGFVVAGYSGRDASIMRLFNSILETHNPFPHGLFWLVMKGTGVCEPVRKLLGEARERGVTAELVEIETFDAVMLRLWRNIESKSATLDGQVRKATSTTVDIPLPPNGTGKPVIRLNALPVLEHPTRALALSFRQAKLFRDVRTIRDSAKAHLILVQSKCVLCWGGEDTVRKTFGEALASIEPAELPADVSSPDTQHLKGFFEEALCWALARGRPLSTRSSRTAAFLIADPTRKGAAIFDQLEKVAGGIAGDILGVKAEPTAGHPHAVQVRWAEALRVSLDQRNGRTWLLIEPDVWVWPQRARSAAVTFLEQRRADRFNSKHNALLSAWIDIILGADEQDGHVMVTAFDGPAGPANPSFRLGPHTAFSRKRVQ